MTWISIVLFFLTHLPELIDVIRKIIELIHSLPHSDQALAKAQFAEAIKAHDVEKVRALTTHWKARCEGVGCPTNLAGET